MYIYSYSKYKKEAKDKANFLREKYRIETPISDIDAIVEKLGGSVVYTLNLGTLYKVEKSKDTFFIYFDITYKMKDVRRKFYIAQALGEYFLQDEKYNAYDHVEFAYEFLMPEEEFIEKLYDSVRGPSFKPNPVADYFQVSPAKVLDRVRMLHLFRH